MHRTTIFLLLVTSAVSLHAVDRAGNWEQINLEMSKGRPKSAIKLLEPLIEKSLAAKDYPEAVKGIGFRIKLEGDIEGRKAEERIARLHTEIEQAPNAMKPVLETLLGHWYWHYSNCKK